MGFMLTEDMSNIEGSSHIKSSYFLMTEEKTDGGLTKSWRFFMFGIDALFDPLGENGIVVLDNAPTHRKCYKEDDSIQIQARDRDEVERFFTALGMHIVHFGDDHDWIPTNDQDDVSPQDTPTDAREKRGGKRKEIHAQRLKDAPKKRGRKAKETQEQPLREAYLTRSRKRKEAPEPLTSEAPTLEQPKKYARRGLTPT